MPRHASFLLLIALFATEGCSFVAPSPATDAPKTATPSQGTADELSVPRLKPKPLVWLDDWSEPEVEVTPARQLATRVNRLADRLKAVERFEEAEKQYLDAMKLDPTWSYPPYQLACNYELWGKHELAVPQFEKALELGFDDFPTALGDGELGQIREGSPFKASLLAIRNRYVEASESRVGQPVAVRPQAAKPEGGWPVMVLLHGYGDSNFSYLDNAKAWAGLGFVAVAVPGSVPATDGRFMWSAESTEPTHQDIGQAVASPLLDDSINREQVFLLGFSQGALHALLLAAEHPDAYAGVVALSPGGSLSERLADPPLSRSGTSSCVFIHGTDEPHAPYVKIWSDACRKAGWRFDSKRHEGGHHFPLDWDTMRPQVASFLKDGSP